MGSIVWLASYPKSGNTWMRAFLHNLLRNPARPVDINTLDQFCLGDAQVYWYEHVSGKQIAELTRRDIARLRPEVHEAFTRAHPDSVFAKTHNMLGQSEGEPLVNLDCTAGAIYVVRNPLDVCLSLADHEGISIDPAIALMADPAGGSETDAINVYEVFGSWSMHVASWTQEERSGLIWVRYEDLLAKPAKHFARVADFLGLAPPRARLEKAVQFSSFDVLQSQEARAGFRERSQHSERFFRSGTAGQWRQALSAAQVDAVVSAHAEQMARFDYLP